MDKDRKIVMSINEELTICCGVHINPTCCNRDDQLFTLRANNGALLGFGDVIGEVTKKYPGCIEFCKDPDHYVLNFPLDLDVKMKIVVVCAIFVMKMMGR